LLQLCRTDLTSLAEHTVQRQAGLNSLAATSDATLPGFFRG
jgi:hypothetical protein